MWHLHRDNKEISEVELTVSNRTVVRVILIILITLALLEIYLKITHAILLIFIAFFLALALNSPVSKIANIIPGKRHGSRSLGTVIAYLLVIILLSAFAAYVVPPIVHQTEKFISAAPSLISNANNQHTSLGHFIRLHHLQNIVTTLSKQVSDRFKGFGGTAFSSITSAASSIFSVITVLVLTFMMLVEGPRWGRIFKDMFVPNKSVKVFDRIMSDMYRVIKGYVNGQVLLAFIAAVLMAPVFFLVGISYPIALVVVVFLSGLIPLIGHPIGAVIVTTVALFHSITAAIIILVVYIIYIQIENYLLQPHIQANTTNMSPLLVFGAIIVGINYGGLIGGLVAIPLAGCFRVLIIEYLAKKKMLPVDFIENSE